MGYSYAGQLPRPADQMQVRTTSAGMQEPVVPDCADLEMIPQLVTDNRHYRRYWERESPSVLAFNLLNLEPFFTRGQALLYFPDP